MLKGVEGREEGDNAVQRVGRNVGVCTGGNREVHVGTLALSESKGNRR